MVLTLGLDTDNRPDGAYAARRSALAGRVDASRFRRFRIVDLKRLSRCSLST